MQSPQTTLMLLQTTVRSLENSLKPDQQLIFRFGDQDMLVGMIELFNETYIQFMGSIDGLPALQIQSLDHLDFSLRIETVLEDPAERKVIGFVYHQHPED